jgi:hypothetical protein
VEKIVYISCKPTSLARDMEMISAAGYAIERWGLNDMFPMTGNIEVCCLLERLRSAKDHIVRIDNGLIYYLKNDKL